MSDESDPPRKFYGFKPREFERANPPPAAPIEPTTPPPVQPAADRPIDVKEIFLQAQVGGPLLSPEASRRNHPNEVHDILRDNHAREKALGLFELTPKAKRRSKRKRDYWLFATINTIVFGPIVVMSCRGVMAHSQAAAMPFVCSLAGLIIVHIYLWWIMWHVQSDY